MGETNSMKMNFLAITANVGTLFEDLKGIEDVWIEEFINVIKKHQPKFVALHCQEIGGKDYKSTMEPVKEFFNKLTEIEAMKEFTTVRGYLDGDFDHVDQFTALGNFYFIHSSVRNPSIFNFETGKFEDAAGKKICSKNICSIPHLRKEKFEQDFFPDCKWSRKGYLRVRWKFCEKIVEFVNIHLFHDDSNLVSVKSTPSPYTFYRKRALKFVLQRLQEEHPMDNHAYLMFGDFNFRLDVKTLVQTLCPDSQQQVVRSPAEGEEVIRILYRDSTSSASQQNESQSKSAENGNISNDKILVKLEKKFFEIEKSLFHPITSFENLRSFDIELEATKESLHEFDVSFGPTYPFSENVSKHNHYMDTRCPSWCDRILLSDSSWKWLHSEQGNSSNVIYDVIGNSVCMGDHKPVYLSFTACLDRDASSVDAKADTDEVNGK